jgi:hypothetical protein
MISRWKSCDVRIRIAAALVALITAPSTALAALPQRTFVSSGGSDASATCSLAAPCRGFTVAIALTAAGGEVIVLDSAGYGGATITKSISIVAPAGVYAGVSVLSGDGITINAAATDVVRLRGLRVNGVGLASGSGIVVNTVGLLDIANVEVNGLIGHGLDFAAPDARLVAADSSFTNNGGDGVHVQSATARSFATFLRSRFDRNGQGVVISSNVYANISESSASYNTGGTNMRVEQGGVANISDCTVSGLDVYGSAYGIYIVDNGSLANITRCKIAGAAYGVIAYGAVAKAVVSDTTVVAAGGTSGAGIGSSAGANVTAERCTVNGTQHGFVVGAGSSALYVSNSTAVNNIVDAFFVYAPGSTIYSRSNNTVQGGAITTGPGLFTTFGAN